MGRNAPNLGTDEILQTGVIHSHQFQFTPEPSDFFSETLLIINGIGSGFWLSWFWPRFRCRLRVRKWSRSCRSSLLISLITIQWLRRRLIFGGTGAITRNHFNGTSHKFCRIIAVTYSNQCRHNYGDMPESCPLRS